MASSEPLTAVELKVIEARFNSVIHSDTTAGVVTDTGTEKRCAGTNADGLRLVEEVRRLRVRLEAAEKERDALRVEHFAAENGRAVAERERDEARIEVEVLAAISDQQQKWLEDKRIQPQQLLYERERFLLKLVKERDALRAELATARGMVDTWHSRAESHRAAADFTEQDNARVRARVKELESFLSAYKGI
jgi:hypothetical protein